MYKLTQGWPQHIESGGFVNPDTNLEYLRWLNGWTEEIKSPLVWSDPVPEVPATFDEEGKELTPFIPAIQPQIIGGGEVIETIVHGPHTLEPYVAPPPVAPVSISMRQARLALLQAGLLDTVNEAMATMPQAAQIEWEYASEVARSNALIGAMATSLGMTEQQLDDLFLTASTL